MAFEKIKTNQKTKVMEKEDLAETYASGINLNTTKTPVPHLIEQAYLDGYQKCKQEAKIVEGMKMDEEQNRKAAMINPPNLDDSIEGKHVFRQEGKELPNLTEQAEEEAETEYPYEDIDSISESIPNSKRKAFLKGVKWTLEQLKK